MTAARPVARPGRFLPASPAEAARHVFGRLAALDPPPRPDPPVDLTRFQADAVRRSWRILQHRGGVLVADPAGIGKTYVALGLIDESIRAGARTVLIAAPAPICGLWTRRLAPVAAARGLPIRSRGGTAGPAMSSGPAGMLVLSHSMIGLGRWPAWIGAPDLVIVDEAHTFRNARTRRYAGLAALCRTGRVLLLTATPINNRLQDLYFLIRLFLPDGGLTDLGVPSLRETFESAATAPPDAAAPPAFVRAVCAVLVRRSRREIRAAYAEDGPRFPDRAPPLAVRWSLRGAPAMLDHLGALQLQPFGLSRLARNRSRNIRSRATERIELVRFVLLKRLESGLVAFAASIARLTDYLHAFRTALAGGLLLRPADFRGVGRFHAGQLTLFELVLDPLPRGLSVGALDAGVAADLDRLLAVAELAEQAVREGDPKIAALRALLAGDWGDGRVIIFSEFRETAAHLFRELAPAGRVGLIHGDEARIASGPVPRRLVVERFAPVANEAPEPAPGQAIDTLIATDVLSEGLNLQDAAAVISYDLPWNPVRLIQRLGRIDRLGSPHRVVRSCNFIPDRDLDAVLGLVSRIRRKLAAARRGLGGASARTASGAGRRVAFREVVGRIAAGDGSVFADLEEAATVTDPLDEGLHTAIDRAARGLVRGAAGVGGEEPGADRAAVHVPVSAMGAGPWGVIALSGAAVSWLVVDEGGRVLRDRDAVLRALLDASSTPAPGAGPDVAAARRAYAAAIRFLTADTRPESRGAGRTERGIARGLTRSLSRLPGGPDPALCLRVDALLGRLRYGTRSGLARRLDEILLQDASATGDGSGPARLAVLLSRLEAELDRAEFGNPAADRTVEIVALVRLNAAAA